MFRTNTFTHSHTHARIHSKIWKRLNGLNISLREDRKRVTLRHEFFIMFYILSYIWNNLVILLRVFVYWGLYRLNSLKTLKALNFSDNHNWVYIYIYIYMNMCVYWYVLILPSPYGKFPLIWNGQLPMLIKFCCLIRYFTIPSLNRLTSYEYAV